MNAVRMTPTEMEFRRMEGYDQHFTDMHTYTYHLAREVVGPRYRKLLMAGVPRKEAWETANEGVRRPTSNRDCSCRGVV